MPFYLQALQYDGYGKDLIKHYKCSPDAWAQLVMHLAFFNMEGSVHLFLPPLDILSTS